MGEEPDRVMEAQKDPSPQDLKRLETEIAASRERLSGFVAELDRRRHDLLSFTGHPLRIAAIALAAAALAAGATAVIVRARARPRRLRKRSRQMREAFGRIVRHPERVASDAKSPLARIAVAVAPILVKKIADAALRRRRS